MDKAREEIDTPTTMPEDDLESDGEDMQMMDFEDELDKMEDAFETVQNKYGNDDSEEVEDDKRRKRTKKHRKHRKCSGDAGWVKICKKFRSSMKMLRKEKKEIRH